MKLHMNFQSWLMFHRNRNISLPIDQTIQQTAATASNPYTPTKPNTEHRRGDNVHSTLSSDPVLLIDIRATDLIQENDAATEELPDCSWYQRRYRHIDSHQRDKAPAKLWKLCVLFAIV